jgi:hypothetical protein
MGLGLLRFKFAERWGSTDATYERRRSEPLALRCRLTVAALGTRPQVAIKGIRLGSVDTLRPK